MVSPADTPTPGPVPALTGRRILVTRPAHQADTLCRLIENHGGKALRLPLLSIVPATHGGGVRRLLESARGYDAWIFTSANAVQHARQLGVGDWPVQVAAVGAATAAALESRGCTVITPVANFSSEGLLELPQFQQVQGQRLLIVTGAEGLQVLAPALRERGAEVDVAEVYRRVPLPYDGEHVAGHIRACHAVVMTSAQALQHLLRLTPEPEQPRLLRLKLVVPGSRMVEKAVELGFRSPLTPETMSDAGMIQALIRALDPTNT